MDGEKKIIKAEDLKKTGTKVETVDLGKRKFNAKLFKGVQVNDQPIELEKAAQGEPDAAEPEAAEPQEGEQDEQVKLEQFHNEEGELTGLRITCKCGEVIDLEFTRD